MTAHSTLLFIPDISGFTEFVHSTEIKHSRHIISELLEIIVNCDQLGMHVSEIEGDAVLCYKDDIPTLAELVQQCETTFKNFHSHLKRYDTERICRCGACETASNLSLKFFIHSGEVEKIKVRDHEKLHGSDVILVHRLMKNSINSSEYILFSEAVSNSFSNSETPSWFKLNDGTDSYDSLGKVKYHFAELGSLHTDIPTGKSISFPELSSERISVDVEINAPLSIVYENFTNFEKRLEWNQEIKDIILQDDKKFNEAGALHTCLVGNNMLDIETIGRLEDNDKIIYGERLNKFSVIRDLITIFTFEKHGQKTHVSAEIDFKIRSVFKWFLKPLIKKKLLQQNNNGFIKLKEVSESESTN
ncbi:MAG: DUF2652 domain-containing protein [Draconibacterium sp.]|nr:DUF2652 domain-containing protein [Draconibacterium sp.]